MPPSMDSVAKSRIVVLLLSLFIAVLCSGVVSISDEFDSPTSVNPDAILKTIKSDRDGEIVDCVDIYRQPAFSHPLLVNHTIQMRPSSYPTELGVTARSSSHPDNFSDLFTQSWHKNGEYCPEGTIPIARSKMNSKHRKMHPKAFSIEQNGVDAPGHEHAQVTLEGGNYHGGTGTFNVWNPTVESSPEFSLAQIWVIAGDGPDLNTVEAGWIVNPLTNNSNTNLFAFWTSDGYRSTGCYNLECPGFVQTSNKIALGMQLTEISQYNGQQFDSKITVHKDATNENWWLQVQSEEVGYWPATLFKALSGTATSINWGGEIINTNQDGHHTATQMGSGHFSSQGWKKAAFVRNLGYIDENCYIRDPDHDLIPFATRHECYSVHMGNFDKVYGAHFYFGGPGFSPSCQ